MKGDKEVSSEVRDFKEVLSTPVDGELPVVVGGHAVHLWALAFRDRLGGVLDEWLPFTSKDLDFYGGLQLLQGLKREFGGEYRLSGPRSPVIGQLVVKLGGIHRTIDVLRAGIRSGWSLVSLQGASFDRDVPSEGRELGAIGSGQPE